MAKSNAVARRLIHTLRAATVSARGPRLLGLAAALWLAACAPQRPLHLPDPPPTANETVREGWAAADTAYAACAEDYQVQRFPWQAPVAAGIGAVGVLALGGMVLTPFAASSWLQPQQQAWVNALAITGLGLLVATSAASAGAITMLIPAQIDRASVQGTVLESAGERAAALGEEGTADGYHQLSREIYEDCRVAQSSRDAGAASVVIRDLQRYRREHAEALAKASGAATERQDLESINQKLEAAAQERDAELKRLQARSETNAQRLASLENDLAERTAENSTLRGEVDRLMNEQAQLSSKAKALLEEKRRLEEKTSKYEEVAKALEKEVKAGKLAVRRLKNGVVVEMQNKVLFPSGSAELNDIGKETLVRVADAIKDMNDQRIRIEGHTDTVPVGKNSEFKSNWELSSARALAVTKHLQEAGVNPARMSAEARSQYAPVASNKSAKGRALNRRIEIYLVPDAEGARAKWRPDQ